MHKPRLNAMVRFADCRLQPAHTKRSENYGTSMDRPSDEGRTREVETREAETETRRIYSEEFAIFIVIAIHT